MSVDKVLKTLPDIFSFSTNDYSRFITKKSVEEDMQQRWYELGDRLYHAIEIVEREHRDAIEILEREHRDAITEKTREDSKVQ